jgi:6-phosphogluconate dehydrogenase
MEIGLIGLGKMGSNIATRLLRAGHEVVGLDVAPGAGADLETEGMRRAGSLGGLLEALAAPRVIWMMLPPGAATSAALDELERLLAAGDLVIEGGNSNFHDSLRHAARYAERGAGFLDVGVSGGIWGLEDGFGLLVGGDAQLVERAAPAFDAIAAPDGWGHVGASGTGHYAKMVHNAVEYALMQAYAEGYELLNAFDLDAPEVLGVWSTACSARSWLLDHFVAALRARPDLDGVQGYVEDSGMGRWALKEATDHAVPVPVIASALFARFASRQEESPAMQSLAALREQIGGHQARVAG